MNTQDILDSAYFYGEDMYITFETGQFKIPIKALFSQTLTMLDDLADDEEMFDIINSLKLELEEGISLLNKLSVSRSLHVR